jgi:glyoxylase-like metal-dependent hydrolase (beta-lactamase superfamily II)
MSQIPVIVDTKMHGRERITGAFVIRGEKTAIIETGPKSSAAVLLAGLKAEGVESLDWIVVTHIHLDHAGAAGTLARHFPEATVAVHHVGAPHLVDPAKLWASATRIYGDDMDRLWGGIDPISPDRIVALDDGDKVDLGGRSLQAIDTPGHAGHHHAYLDDATGILFCGDALGVRLPEIGRIRPATPPPEFRLNLAVQSIERIRGLEPSELYLTHFGPVDAPIGETCDQAISALQHWESWVKEARTQTKDLDEATAIVRAAARKELEHGLAPEDVDRMERTTSYRMNVSGYMRYLDKTEAAS